MVKYSSRVGSSGAATTAKPRGQPPNKKKLAPSGGDIALGASPISDNKDSILQKEIIAALKEEKKIMTDTTVRAGNLTVSAGNLPSAGDIQIGGDIKSDLKQLEKSVKSIPKIIKKRLDPNKAVDTLKSLVDKLTHNGMIQVLQHMTGGQFHILQGVAGAHLPNFDAHPLIGISKLVLGGSFTHPRDISKMATRDIMRAVSPQQLSTALYMEMKDSLRNINVGGGLLSSLKHHFKRGLEGLRSKLSAGTKIGKTIQKALEFGINAGKIFSPIVEQIFPGAGALISSGISAAEALKAGLEKGVRIGEKVEKGLELISPLVSSSRISKDSSTVESISSEDKNLPPIREEQQKSLNPSFAGLNQDEISSLGFNP